MATLFAKRAFLEGRWSHDVRVTVGSGRVTALEVQAERSPQDEPVGILLPGVCNAHSHAFQRALVGRTEHRSTASSDTFWTWRELMYRVAGQLDPPDLEAIARQAYCEMLRSGYTAVVEFHYLHRVGSADGPNEMRDALYSAAKQAGIRLTYLPVYYEQADFGGAPLTQAQQRFGLSLEQYLEHLTDSQKHMTAPHAVGAAAHSLRAVSPAALEVIAEVANDAEIPLHLHIAEQLGEVDGALAHLGQRPVRWLLDTMPVNERWTLVHATHMEADEVADTAHSGAVVCVCPSTEGNLGDGFFPLASYLSAGGALAIGSDSHVTIDPFEELRWLEYGQRLLRTQRNVAAIGGGHTGSALFSLAVAGGSQAAASGATGIEVGRPADFLSMDMNAPVFAGLATDEVLDALVFAGLPSPLTGVMVNGDWRVKNGAHVAAAEITEGYRAVMERLGPKALR